jgi:hypothetical protein
VSDMEQVGPLLRGEEPPRKLYRSLAELMADPTILQEPAVVIPRLIWRQRTTLFAAREKIGKSTFLGWAAAALSRGGQWLGETMAAANLLWVGKEEHPGDIIRRFVAAGADAARVFIQLETPEGLQSIASTIAQMRPAATFIDTLASMVENIVEDPNDSVAWNGVMNTFGRMARDGDTGIAFAAHARKSDGRYRDSTAIGAGVDVIEEMDELGANGTNGASSHRRIRARGRWAIGDYSVRFDGKDGFSLLSAGEIPMDLQVLDFIRAHTGSSKRAVRDGVGGRKEAVDAALTQLVERGLVMQEGTGNNHLYRAPIYSTDANLTGTLRGTLGAHGLTSRNSLRGNDGHGVGTVHVPMDPNPERVQWARSDEPGAHPDDEEPEFFS